MKLLFCMSGKIGDILWGCVAARKWAESLNSKTDFMIGPASAPVAELLEQQSYVGAAFVESVPPLGYDLIKDASYRGFPDIALPLYTARNTGIELDAKAERWITPVSDFVAPSRPYATYAFNSLQPERKRDFIEALRKRLPSVPFVCMSDYPWHVSAAIASRASWFIGCRCSNFVLAHAVGCRRIIIFEPEEGRRNPVFSSPWAPEHAVETPEQAEAAMLAP